MSEPDRTGRRPSSLDIGRAQRALVQLAEAHPSKWLTTRELAALVGASKHDRRLAVALELSGWRRHWPRSGRRHLTAWAKPGVKTRRYQRLMPTINRN